MKDMVQLNRILVPVDKSDSSLISQETAASLAKKIKAEVTVLHVIPSSLSYEKMESQPASQYIPSTVEEGVLRAREREMATLEGLYKEGERIMDEARSLFEEEQVEVNTDMIRENDVAQTLIDYSRNFDLTVMGSHGENQTDLYALGSVTKKVIRETNCPTLVVKKVSAFQKMLVCVEDSEHSIGALKYASALAEKLSSQITLLNVSESTVSKKSSIAIKKVGNQVLRDSPYAAGFAESKFEEIVEQGFPPNVIPDVAQKGQFDLIVLGRKAGKTRGFSPKSVVEEVAERAKCPVLIVPQRD